MNEVRLPRLLANELEGGCLKEKARFHPYSLSITLNLLPLSTATMTIPEDDPDVKIHDFIELYNQHGSVGIFRVSGVSTNYKKQRVIDLNHALDVLNDSFYVHSGGSENYKGTVSAFLTKILACQQQGINGTAYWQLGTCADAGSWNKKLEFNNALELISEVAKKHEDYMMVFDFSTFPWTINFVSRQINGEDPVFTEFRLSRNIESCNVSLDDSGLCTRLYLSVSTTTTVKEQGQTAGDKTTQTYYTFDDAAGQANWGVVCETAGVNAADLPEGADINARVAAWVSAYFERHNSPTVQITINGEDLKELTGEAIDEVHLGRICRVALPEYTTTFLERVTAVTYPDALRKPTYVTVALANKRQTAEDSIAAYKKEQTKSGGGGGGGGGSQNLAENTATEVERQKIIHNVEVEKTDEKFSVLATEQQWNELIQQYETTEKTQFTITSEAIASEVIRATGAEAGLSSTITQTAGQLQSQITSLDGSYSSLTQTVSGIDARVGTNETDISQLKVDVNGIYLQGSVIHMGADSIDVLAKSDVTVSGNTVTINGNAIYLEGAVDAVEAKIDNLTSGVTQAAAILVSGLVAENIQTDALIVGSSTYSAKSVSLGSGVSSNASVLATADINLPHGHTVTCTESNGEITITVSDAVSGSGSDSFNMAATNWYAGQVAALKSAVSTALASASWNGSASTNIACTLDTTNKRLVVTSASVSIAYPGDSSATPVAISLGNLDLSTKLTEYYEAAVAKGEEDGWALAYAEVDPPTAGNGTSFTFDVPAETKGESKTYTFTVQKGATPASTGYASVARDNIVVGRIEIGDWYDAGVTEGIKQGEGQFDLASVTLQGALHKVTTIGTPRKFTYTQLYKGGTATYYEGNGAGVYGRGSMVPVHTRGSEVHFQTHPKVEAPTGTWYEYVGSSGGNATYYKDGGTEYYYDGNGSYVVGRGSEVTVNTRGSSQWAYVVDETSGGRTLYEKGDELSLYDAGSTVSDTYYTKQATQSQGGSSS